MKQKKKSLIAAGLLALLFGNRAVSQDIQLHIPKLADIKVEMPFQKGPFYGTDFSFNLESEIKSKEIEYDFKTCYENNDFSAVYPPFIQLIKDNANSPLQIPLDDIKNLTDNQKLVFLSLLSNQINGFAYDKDTNCCRHIATNIERISNNIGLPAAVVSGIMKNREGHAYNIIKTEEGVSIVDSYLILSSESKNVEKVLEAYQKEMGYPMFKQEFYKDSKFHYALTTKDGRNFLDFIGYDPSLDVIKDSLQNRKKYEADFKFEGNVKDNFFSFLASFFGTYVKGGKIKENLSEREILMGQVGINPKIIIPNILSIVPEVSFVYGKMENSYFASLPLGITVSTENAKGINLSARVSGMAVNIPKQATLYANLSADLGASYSFNLGNAKLEPYILSQFSGLIEDIKEGEKTRKLRFSELEAGLKISLPIKHGNIIFEPHYSKRIWEDEVGAKLRIGTGTINGNLEASVSKSGYEFCPDKLNIKSGIDLSINNITIGAGYKAEGTNYEGEKELNSSFYLNGKIKLK
jgi:hypothetical protein